MGKLFETVVDIDGNHETIRRRAYGMIEIRNERFHSLQFRPWPKIGSIVEAAWAGGWGKKSIDKNRCLLFFSQPILHRNYLTLNYVVSNLYTSMTTALLSLSVLDQVAAIKRSDAILCDITNARISDRFMKRYHWEPQDLNGRRRQWIKRFYGEYPTRFLYQKFEKRDQRTELARPDR